MGTERHRAYDPKTVPFKFWPRMMPESSAYDILYTVCIGDFLMYRYILGRG